MGPIWDQYIPNIGLPGQPLADPRKYQLHSHLGTQMAATDRPQLGAHIDRTWAPPENVIWGWGVRGRFETRPLEEVESFGSGGSVVVAP